jgi:hypothetical protein
MYLLDSRLSLSWVSVTFYVLLLLRTSLVGRVAQSVKRLDTGWTVRGSNPSGGGGRFSALSRPALGPIQPPVQWVPGLSRGLKAAGA